MANNLSALPLGSMLSDYLLESILGQGGFGITYLATDTMLKRKVAVKEYYPREFAIREGTLRVHASGSESDHETFKWGLQRFLEEARLLARFDHPNIIPVRRFFEANGTAYLVMDYCEGESLEELLNKGKKWSTAELIKLTDSLFDALDKIHASHFLHRDIKPANIFIQKMGNPVLLDFGAARQELISHSKSVTSLASPGYAAFEQYSTSTSQGPYTDIYGLGATLYRIVTGEKPFDAPDRILDDTLIPASEKVAGKYPISILSAIDKAIEVRPNQRPQTISELRTLFKVDERNALGNPYKAKKDLPIGLDGNTSPSVSKKSNLTKLIIVVLVSLATLLAIYKYTSLPNEIQFSNQEPKPINIPETSAVSDQRELIKKEPVIKEPVIKEPVIKEPVIKEPVIKEPVIKEPVIKEPVIKEPTKKDSPKVKDEKSNDLATCKGADPIQEKWSNCQATYKFESGEFKDDVYNGEFQNGLFHGDGTYLMNRDGVNNGDKYVGQFKNGKPNGRGVYYFKAGFKYIGEFSNGNFDGVGTKYDKNGAILYSGRYINGFPPSIAIVTPNPNPEFSGSLDDCKREVASSNVKLPIKLDDITTTVNISCVPKGARVSITYWNEIDNGVTMNQGGINTIRGSNVRTVCNLPQLVKLYDFEYKFSFKNGTYIGSIFVNAADCALKK
jgi:serine/threonine protein kinase